MRVVGVVYRAHNPRWAFDPLSGAGAAAYGGRFNRPGSNTLYLSMSIETAVREAAQGFAGKLNPLTIVAYDADVSDVVDLTSPESRHLAGIELDYVGAPWKLIAARRETVPTWTIAERLIGEGAAGILAPSFARGAGADDINLVLWRWGPDLPHRLLVHDPEQRLPKNQKSWE